MTPMAITLAGLLAAAMIITIALARLYLNNRKEITRLRGALHDVQQKLRLMVILFEETLGQYPQDNLPPLDERVALIFDHLSTTTPGVPMQWYQLRPQTRVIFKHHIDGQTQAQLARQFKLTRDQVRTHLTRACQALGAADIRQAAARAGKYGLLDDVL